MREETGELPSPESLHLCVEATQNYHGKLQLHLQRKLHTHLSVPPQYIPRLGSLIFLRTLLPL